MNATIKKELISKNEIEKRVKELGEKITADYKGKDLVIIGILKGSVIFMCDLIRSIDMDFEIDFMSASSYSGTHSLGELKIKKDIDIDIKDKHVILVEDIIDTGLTLSKIKELFKQRDAASVKICVFLDKVDTRKEDMAVDCDYVGFSVPNEFVIGYGLDYDEFYRGLPYIGVLELDK